MATNVQVIAAFLGDGRPTAARNLKCVKHPKTRLLQLETKDYYNDWVPMAVRVGNRIMRQTNAHYPSQMTQLVKALPASGLSDHPTYGQIRDGMSPSQLIAHFKLQGVE